MREEALRPIAANDLTSVETAHEAVIQLKDAVVRHPDLQFAAPLNWSLLPGENVVLIGPNGAGKSLLMDVLSGKIALKSGELRIPALEYENRSITQVIRSMAFKDISSITPDYEHSSYQQRWNSQEAESSPLAIELIRLHPDTAYTDLILDLLEIRSLLDRKMIHLSSGELRKFLIARTLMSRPRVLMLDNPFIGLDAASRDRLNATLKTLSELEGLQLVFVLSNPSDIPDFVNQVYPMFDRRLLEPLTVDAFRADKTLLKTLFPIQPTHATNREFAAFDPSGSAPDEPCLDAVVRLSGVTIRYGSNTILNELFWTIKKGERWALLGPNGSGKSTLLSLICADNPQAYANNLELFGVKRGSGESIWDIKRNIGYVSPEMHHYYLKNVPCKDIVGSGLFDTIGLYRNCNKSQLETVATWMERFGIEKLAEKSFLKISSGEQRLCLLARAFVKEPSLLIMDEPLHGLDASNKLKTRQIIDEFCNDASITLIYVTHYPEEMPTCVSKQFLLKKS